MEIDAFILVGGRSSRFGRDKATLNFGGTTLVQRTAATIRNAIAPPRITLVAASAEQIVNIFGHQETLPFIFDVYPDRGPFGAVHAALAHARTDWILILACDFPFISSELLQWLSADVLDEHDTVVPIQPDGNIQPLCALYRVKPCLAVVEETLIKNRPTPPVWSICEKVLTRFVPFYELDHLPGSQNFFFNVNTPESFSVAAGLLAAD